MGVALVVGYAAQLLSGLIGFLYPAYYSVRFNFHLWFFRPQWSHIKLIFTADKTCLWRIKIIKLLVMAEKTLICVHVSGKSKWSLIRALAHKQKEEEHRYLNSNWPNQMDLLFKRQPVLRRIKRPNLVYLWLQCNSITRKASSTSGCSNTCVKNRSIFRSKYF